MNGKFRVWDVDENEYSRRDFSITQDGKLWMFMDWDNPPMECPPDNYIVEYSTGLSASKSYLGKKPEDLEIYAGDILRHRFGKDYEYERELEVFWYEENAQFAFIMDELNWRYAKDLDEVEIIGNIHEEVKP